MRDQLILKYGPVGFHLLALEDIYKSQEQHIGQDASTQDRWTQVSDRLSETFQSGAKSLADVSWQTVVEARDAIPAGLDMLIETIKDVLSAAGDTIKQLILAVADGVRRVWAYIRGLFVGSADKESSDISTAEGESNTLYNLLTSYPSNLFKSLARKLAAGMLVVFENLRELLYAVGAKMMEFFYGGAETLTGPDSERLGISMLMIPGEVLQLSNEPLPLAQQKLTDIMTRTLKDVDHVRENLEVGIMGKTVQWIKRHLSWIGKLVAAVASSIVSVLQSLCGAATYLGQKFGTFVQTLRTNFEESINTEIPPQGVFDALTFVQGCQEIRDNWELTKAERRSINRAIEIATYMLEDEGDMTSTNSAVTSELVMELLTNQYQGKDLDLGLVNQILLSSGKTGMDGEQLVYFRQAAAGNASAALSAVMNSVLGRLNLTEEELAASIAADLRIVDGGVDESTLTEKERNTLESYKTKSQEELRRLKDEVEERIFADLESIRQLEAIHKSMVQSDPSRYEHMMSTLVKLRAELRKRGIIKDKGLRGLSESPQVAENQVFENALIALENNVHFRDLHTRWTKVKKDQERLALIQYALNQVVKQVTVAKNTWYIVAAVLSVACWGVAYAWFCGAFDPGVVLSASSQTPPSTDPGFWSNAWSATKDTVLLPLTAGRKLGQVVSGNRRTINFFGPDIETQTPPSVSPLLPLNPIEIAKVNKLIQYVSGIDASVFTHYISYGAMAVVMETAASFVQPAMALLRTTHFVFTIIGFGIIEFRQGRGYSNSFGVMSRMEAVGNSLWGTFWMTARALALAFIANRAAQGSFASTMVGLGLGVLNTAFGLFAGSINPLGLVSKASDALKGAAENVVLDHRKFFELAEKYSVEKFQLSKAQLKMLNPINMSKELKVAPITTFAKIFNFSQAVPFNMGMIDARRINEEAKHPKLLQLQLRRRRAAEVDSDDDDDDKGKEDDPLIKTERF